MVFSLAAERAGEAVVFRPKEEVEEVVLALAVVEVRGRVEGGGAMEALREQKISRCRPRRC